MDGRPEPPEEIFVMQQPRIVFRVLLCLALVVPGVAAAQAPAAPPSSSPATADQGDALRRAASVGDVARVRELLAAGVDVNSANAYGGTALAFACDKGHLEVVKVLLDKGADLEAKDRFYSSTPLQWAAVKGHAEIARMLLAKGAKGEAELLALAAGEGSAPMVRVVLERGQVNATALSEALATAEAAPEGKGKEVAELLRAAGVQPPAAVVVDPAVLQSYAGAYEPEGAAFRLTVKFQDGKLIGEGGGGPPLTLVPSDPTHFRAQEFPTMKVAFDVQDGTVRGLTVDNGGRTMTLRKIEGETKP
jgi:hypothetical protein